MNIGRGIEKGLGTLRRDEVLEKMDWPDLQRIEVPVVGVDDCLLICAGFEERSVEVLRRICEAGYTGFSIILVDYLPKYDENKLEGLSTMIQRANLTMTRCVYDRANPAGIGETLEALAGKCRRVVVDISGMSRLLIVQTMVALISRGEQPPTLLYCEAETYPPSQTKFEAVHGLGGSADVRSYLSSGVIEVASTPELSSVSMQGESTRLIGFPSFDPAQLDNLFHELQPTYAEIIHGLPPAPKDRWRREAISRLNNDTLKELQQKNEHESSTLDYRETLNILLQIYAERSMFDRLVVAPTGSKMQTVAVGLFRAALHDVQVVYPTPQSFTEPQQYTLGCRQLYELDLPTEVGLL